jgi:two-component system, OmpR family, sensor histidine kinase VanS
MTKRVNSAADAAAKAGGHDPAEAVKSLEQANAELREQIGKLQALKEMRSASIAHLGHELRTPLTSILGFSEIMLSQEKLTDTQRNFCERIQNSANQLQRTLNQLAELSRLDITAADGQTESSES